MAGPPDWGAVAVAPEQPPAEGPAAWGAQAVQQPATSQAFGAGIPFTPLTELPDQPHGLNLSQAIMFEPIRLYRGIRDLFLAPGTAAKEGMSPEKEIEFGTNMALMDVMGRAGSGESQFAPRPGLVKAAAPAIKEFQDTVIDPGIQQMVQQVAETPPPLPKEGEPAPHPLQALYDHLQTLDEAKQFGIIDDQMPPKPAASASERAFQAYPVGAQVTPEAMKGRFGHDFGAYDAKGKEWVDKINAPDDVRQGIENIAQQYDWFPEARAGKASPEARAFVAEAAGIDPAEVDPAYFSEHFDNDGKVLAIIQVLNETADNFAAASKKFAAEPTEENAAAALEAQEKQRYAVEYTLGKRAESGRSLAAWKDLLRETERSNARATVTRLEGEGKAPAGASDLIKAAGDVVKRIKQPKAGEPIGLSDLIKAAEKLGTEEKPAGAAKLDGVAKAAREAAQTPNDKSKLQALIDQASELSKTKPLGEAELQGPKGQGLATMLGEVTSAVGKMKATTGFPAPNTLISLAEKAERLSMEAFGGRPKIAPEALDPAVAQLIDQAKATLADMKKGAPAPAQFERLIKAAEKQAADMTKQKPSAKPADVLPPELQALVDKAELVVDRFGGVAKGERAAFLLARAGRTAAEQAELARQVEGLTPNQIAKVLERVRKNPRPGWLFWSVQQGLISGLITHTKYAFVNTASTLTDRVIAPEIAAIIGRMRGEKTSLMAPLRAIPAMIEAVPDAFAGVKQAFKTNARVPLQSELRLAERGEKSPQAAGAAVPYGVQMGPDWGIWRKVFNDDQLAKAEKVIGVPGRSANSIHTFFKIINERAAASSRAMEATFAEEKKFGTDEFRARYQHHLDHPTDEVLRANVEDGYSGTFMEELGTKSKDISRFIRNTPFKWLVFFTHIPLNMARKSIEYSPLALLNTLGETKMGAAIKGELGPHAQNLALAKMTVGSAVGAYFIHKALNGQATGDYPTDPKERLRWQQMGIQPNSLLIDGSWVNMERLGPQATVARIAANYAHVIEHSDGSQDDAMMKAGLALVLGTVKALSDDVGFQTIANVVNVLENPQEAARFAAWQLSSYAMPVSMITQFASAMDPEMRRADTLVKGLMYHLPLVREQLLPKRDPLYGEPVHNPGYHSILRESPLQSDPAKLEMDRLGVWKGAPQRRLGGIKLNDDLYDEYEATAGPLVKQLLRNYVQSPEYETIPDAMKKREFEGLIKVARAQGRLAMFAHHPELWQQALDARKTALFGKP